MELYNWHIKELIVIKQINAVKILTGEKIMQTSREHKHSEIKRFSTLNEQIISQKTRHCQLWVTSLTFTDQSL